jgi:site-specific DNA recombinase
MKTAIYIRVSTEEQVKEGFSISAQRNKLEAYCVSQGWDVIGFYVDEGISAKDMERPELKRMIKHIEQGVIECVLVYRLDRLTRSVLDLYNLLDLFEKHSCKFKSSTEVYDTTTAMGRMFITIVAALAQWERENLGERVRMGMQEKARQGKWVSNIPPYGYELDRENETLAINDEEAKIVKMIFQEYISGNIGFTKLANKLNHLNIDNRGVFWSDQKIRYIIKNPLYIGRMRYNFRLNKENYFEVDDAVPPIIDKDIFEKANLLLERRSHSHPKSATSRFIFSGTLKCSRCGGSLSGHQSQSKRGEKKYISYQYICRAKRLGMCTLPPISEMYLEHQFIEELKKIVIHEQEVKVDLPTNDTDYEIKSLEKELEQISKRKTKWQWAWANEAISDDDFLKRMNEENEKEGIIKNQIQKLDTSSYQQRAPEQIKAYLSDIMRNWNHLDLNEKKTFIQLMIRSVEVDKSETISRKPESVIIKGVEYY